MRYLLFAVAALAAAWLSPANNVHAAPILGGTTSVTLTSAPVLAGAGVTVSPFGMASISGPADSPVASFPITGGDASPGGLLIEHDGSGLDLGRGGDVASVRNFLIDTALATVFADAFANGSFVANLPLFSIGTGLTLSLTSQGAGALTTVLGLPDLTGTLIGTAVTNPLVAVPVPAGIGFVVGGLGVLAALRRRRVPVAA